MTELEERCRQFDQMGLEANVESQRFAQNLNDENNALKGFLVRAGYGNVMSSISKSESGVITSAINELQPAFLGGLVGKLEKEGEEDKSDFLHRSRDRTGSAMNATSLGQAQPILLQNCDISVPSNLLGSLGRAISDEDMSIYSSSEESYLNGGDGPLLRTQIPRPSDQIDHGYAQRELGLVPHARPSSIVPQYDMTHKHNLRSAPYEDVTSEAMTPETPLESLSSPQLDDLLDGAREDGVFSSTQANYTPTMIGGGNMLGLSNGAFIGLQAFDSISALPTYGTALSTWSIFPAPTILDHPHASKYLAPELCTGVPNDLRMAGDFGSSLEVQAQTCPSIRPVQITPDDIVMKMASQTLQQARFTRGCLVDMEPRDACAGTPTAIPQEERGRLPAAKKTIGVLKMHAIMNKSRGGIHTAPNSNGSRTCYSQSKITIMLKKDFTAVHDSHKSSFHKNSCRDLSGDQQDESVGEMVPVKPCEGGKMRYSCPLAGCERHFSTNRHARRHSRIHLDLKPFECPHGGCGATFTRRDNCTQHQRVLHRRVVHSPRLTREGGR